MELGRGVWVPGAGVTLAPTLAQPDLSLLSTGGFCVAGRVMVCQLAARIPLKDSQHIHFRKGLSHGPQHAGKGVWGKGVKRRRRKGVPIVAQQYRIPLVSVRMRVQSLASLKMSYGVGHKCSSDPALLWLWCRQAAIAPNQPLACEFPYATGAAHKLQL